MSKKTEISSHSPFAKPRETKISATSLSCLLSKVLQGELSRLSSKPGTGSMKKSRLGTAAGESIEFIANGCHVALRRVKRQSMSWPASGASLALAFSVRNVV